MRIKKMKPMFVGMVVVGFAALATSSAASGTGSLTCTSFLSGTVTTNVEVPAGAICAIGDNATINGNVSVGAGARLFAGTGVTINGNMEATTGAGVLLTGTTLNGNYHAYYASSAILDSNLYGKNVSFTGGSYGLLGHVTKNLGCDSSASGATTATTVAGSNTGCQIGDLGTVLGFVSAAADEAGGSGSGEKPMTCEEATVVGNFLITTGNAMKQAGDNLALQQQGQLNIDVGNAIINSACGPV
jgi:hypothetical protein